METNSLEDAGEEIMLDTGLSIKDNATLNSPRWSDVFIGETTETYEMIDSMRKKYEKSPLALEWIDGYDPRKEYYSKIRQLNSALKSGDEATCHKLHLWFLENYPLTTQKDLDL